MLLRQIPPKASWHILPVEFWVDTFFDGHGFEVGFPHLLEEGFVFSHHVGVDFSDAGVYLEVVEGYFYRCLEVVEEAVFSSGVVDEPFLV